MQSKGGWLLVCYDFQIAVVMVCTRSEAAICFESTSSQRITPMTIEPQYVWLVVGIALIIAEVTMGNFILLFLGVAAVVVGIALSMGMPSTGGQAYFLFAALSVVLLLGVRSRMRKIVVGDIAKGSDDEDFIGHNAVVESGFDDPSPGRGRVVYRGASWDAVSQQACQQVGAVLLIVGREGNCLEVGAPAGSDADDPKT